MWALNSCWLWQRLPIGHADTLAPGQSEILETRDAELAGHEVPMMINIMSALAVGATGKLTRPECPVLLWRNGVPNAEWR